jgi:hypothetical protein
MDHTVDAGGPQQAVSRQETGVGGEASLSHADQLHLLAGIQDIGAVRARDIAPSIAAVVDRHGQAPLAKT